MPGVFLGTWKYSLSFHFKFAALKTNLHQPTEPTWMEIKIKKPGHLTGPCSPCWT